MIVMSSFSSSSVEPSHQHERYASLMIWLHHDDDLPENDDDDFNDVLWCIYYIMTRGDNYIIVILWHILKIILGHMFTITLWLYIL